MTGSNWHRMKEEAEDVVMLVSNKLPGKTIIWLTFGVGLILIFLIGFGVGFGSSSGSGSCTGGDCSIPVYYFVTNHSESCPPLTGERLLTSVGAGQSFEGLTVQLQCRGWYNPVPASVRCQRKKVFDDGYALEWSGVPVCVPKGLISLNYWKQTLHANSVVCTGNNKSTGCSLTCVKDYIAVEEEEYQCSSMPCPAWSMGDQSKKMCYQCDEKCDHFKRRHKPGSRDMLLDMSCDPTCSGVVVTSSGGAGVWQSKRTGLFNFIGEHNGRPLYRKNSTNEYLYYQSAGAEWLIGPDFRKASGGIQMFNNDDSRCPERHGGTNHTKLYIDSSVPLLNVSSVWREDSSLSMSCYTYYTKVVNCSCPEYQVTTDDSASETGQYYTGKFRRLSRDEAYSILAPVYYDPVKQLYLFSHHPEGLVWQISQNFVTTPVRAVTQDSLTCPDSEKLSWEYYNGTKTNYQQVYVKEETMKIKCNW